MKPLTMTEGDLAVLREYHGGRASPAASLLEEVDAAHAEISRLAAQLLQDAPVAAAARQAMKDLGEGPQALLESLRSIVALRLAVRAAEQKS